tara:strand:+ start:1473 stop:1949 length:477 start_codon:yes stop_codon:yes gene_type:complete
MQKTTVLFFIISITGFSQSISKQVIGPGGQTYENGNNKLSYTLGEVVVGAMTDEDGTYQLGNGYYPSLDLTPLSIETPDLDLKIKVFPNPSKEVIFITHPTEQFFNLSISDVSGKQILQTVHQKEQPLNVQTLTIGTYFITVTTKESKQTNTYKIIKQ